MGADDPQRNVHRKVIRLNNAESGSNEADKRPAAVGYVAGNEPATSDNADASSRQTGLEWRDERLRGSHPGDRYVRVARHVPTEQTQPRAIAITARDPGPPKTALGRVYRSIKRALIGRPLASSQAIHERLTKVKALAVLSSDALSSVAYATEETLLVLVLAGSVALNYSIPIGVAITALLAIVAFSYRQTIFAYPHGGGSYIVASDNLGTVPGLIAGAALMIDYVLTVAVSISSGVAALTSAVPRLAGDTVALCILFIVLITIGNLRGIREAGSIFAAPTYLFIGSLLILIAAGLVRAFVFRDVAATGAPREPVHGIEGITILLILRAFSSGCSAMTGVEAISDGVPAFQKPESRNASTTLVWMASLLGTMFMGITILAHVYGLVPRGNETILSQLAHQIVGNGVFGWYYYLFQVATLLVLVLAANTAFSDFPRLGSFLARDGFLPKLFLFRGDRLAFTTGITTLAVLAGILVIIFGGNTTALIPLYAVGVFVSFTLSQSGMVMRWWRQRGAGWATKAAVNATGATATGIVALVVGGTKLYSGEALFRIGNHNVHAGSWIVIILIPLLIMMFLAIHRHYETTAIEQDLATETPLDPEEIRHTLVVPFAKLNRVALQTLAYARSISPNVTAVHISDDPEEIAQLRDAWRQQTTTTPFLRTMKLVMIESPYRGLTAPLLSYIDELDHHDPNETLTVILPEYVPAHWWEHLLHGQTALRLKAALLFRPGTVVTNVPYHLRREGAAGVVDGAVKQGH
ncbi:MAG TPA: APC family permease [Thermomicrobiales bacterium]|jgi:amino acid transporter|nr:APC family permease [Thermomicrobiales bacterium]